MPQKDTLRDVLEKLDQPAVRWTVLVVGIIVLLRLKLVLFAAALPVMAYWHYSNQSEEQGEGDAGDGADGDMDPPGREEEDFDDGFFAGEPKPRGAANDEDPDPYDQSFWAGGESSMKNGKSATGPRGDDLDDDLKFDDDFGLPGSLGLDDDSGVGKPSFGGIQRAGGGGKGKSPLDDDLDFGSFGKTRSGANDGLGGGGDDFDFSFGGGGFGGRDDDDLFGMGGKSKGKGKGKGKDNGKGKDGPREADPKQVFVAGVADLPEEELRMFFEEIGEVDRLKVLRTPEGQSKGVCFVTFRTEDQAQKALGLHGSVLEGRNLTIRLAHGGNKGEKGGGKDKDRDHRPFGGMDRDEPHDLGGSERFGAAFNFGADRLSGKGKSGKGGAPRRNDRGELDELLEEALADSDGPVRPSDFDFAARRFLTEIRGRDRADGTKRFQEAMDMICKYTSSKDRSSVRKWPAYIFTLLQKFDPHLWEELRDRDAERKREKGGGGGFPGRGRDD